MCIDILIETNYIFYEDLANPLTQIPRAHLFCRRIARTVYRFIIRDQDVRICYSIGYNVEQGENVKRYLLLIRKSLKAIVDRRLAFQLVYVCVCHIAHSRAQGEYVIRFDFICFPFFPHIRDT